MRIDGKVAVITGASRGIGRQLALDCAAAGAKVALAARRAGPLEELAAQIEAEGGSALAVPTDVSQRDDCRQLIERAAARFGTVDVLVNNAAISGPSKLVRDLEPDEWEEVLRTNLTSAYLCIHYVVPHMMAQQSGRIINIGSFNGKKAFALRVPYAASKLGLVGLTRCLALELGPYHITVNTISPGAVEGERVDEVIAAMAQSRGLSEEQVREGLLAQSPLHAMVTAQDITRMVLYLASDHGQHMTGQDINVTAGVVMY